MDCTSYIVTHGFCHRHNLVTRQTTSEIPSSLNDTPQTSPPIRSTSTPQKGDIQLIRQQWNGTKWSPLCNYHTHDCSRRSGGIKYAHLCDIHYRESLEKNKQRNAPILLSPTVKRKRCNSFENDSLCSTFGFV